MMIISKVITMSIQLQYFLKIGTAFIDIPSIHLTFTYKAVLQSRLRSRNNYHFGHAPM